MNDRQQKILEIVKENEPITGENIAAHLGLTRSTLRPDLSILTMSGMLDARPKVGYFFTGDHADYAVASQFRSKTIGEVMSLPAVLSDEASVYDAIVAMFLQDAGTLFITSDGFLSGVLSRKDLMKASIGSKDLSALPVTVAMTRMPNLVMALAEETVLAGAKKIIAHEIDSLPVVEQERSNGKVDYRIVGRFSKTNISKLFIELMGE